MRQAMFMAGAALAGAVLSALPAYAAPITITNNSFESNGQTVVTTDQNAIPGYVFTQPSGGVFGVQNQGTPDPVNGPPNTSGNQIGNPVGTDGNFFAFFNLNNAGETGNITSNGTTTTGGTTVLTFQPNTIYTLTVAAQNNSQGGGYGTPGNSNISLLANGTAVSTSTTIVGSAIPNDTSVDLTTTFTTGALGTGVVGQNLQIAINTFAPAGTGSLQSLFDNVRLDASPVPEPASLSLLALGGLGLLARRRRSV